VEFRLLGPLGVQAERHDVALGGPRQRLLVALLLLRANEVVTVDRLVDDLWGDEPPAAARSSLYAYVSRLRKAIGHDRLVDGSAGYLLRAADDEIDARRFEAALADARRRLLADPGRAAIVLDEALALWRGPALADLSDEPALQAEITRLSELRLSALEMRIEAGLALGRHDEQIGVLESLLAREPLREHAWGQLMLALYRSGRQGDALDAYLRARSVLAEELGVDPSPELERLQQQILRQDPDLEVTRRRVRGYELREPIGSGAFGTVYRAIQPELGREVAVKVIHEGLANDPEFIRGFEREAQLVAGLEHPHVVPLYDYWREPGSAYLVLRYLRGGNLRERIAARGRLPGEEVLRIVDDVALALDAAHRSGIVHRDVRPPNILFDTDGNAYLSDFGIARQVAVSAADAATPIDPADYVSPEQALGEAATPASDVYSLGLVLFELLAGRHPFAGTRVAGPKRQARARLPSLSVLRPDLPSGVEDVIRRATARRPRARFQDAGALAAALRAALEGTSAVLAKTEIRNPYKGLQPFSEADAPDFFGRDALVDSLIERMAEPIAAARFLAVVGPSGSGKSSVVRAGLIPRLREGSLPGSEGWFVVEMHPGRDPFEELAEALLRVADTWPPRLADELAADRTGLLRAADALLPGQGGELLLFVDQFEELFTLTASEPSRAAFLAALSTAVSAPGSRLRVVATLRADFFDRPLLYREFGDLLAARTEVVTPMSADELERAVIGPAKGVGLSLEPALVAEIVADTLMAPASLPLLQHALSELVQHRQGIVLTHASYREIGGVPGAVARRAEQLVARLDRDGREAVRQVFLRLVAVTDDGTTDVRRRVSRAELDALALAPGAVQTVLDRFGRHRLLSFDRDPATRSPTVEVAHEALLREWSRLRGWIDTAREDVLTHRRLASALADWQAAGEDQSFLLRGSRLSQLEGWAATTGILLTTPERAFLEASSDLRGQERAAEEARQARETALERRSRRRLRALAMVMAVAAVVAGGLSLYAFDQQRQASAQARVATARELAAAAVANLDVDPELSILLAREAVRTTRSEDASVLPEAVEALHRALQANHLLAAAGWPLERDRGVMMAVALRADGRAFAVSADGAVVDVFDAVSRQRIRTIGTPVQGAVAGFAWPMLDWRGSRLAALGPDGVLRIWDAVSGSELLAWQAHEAGPGVTRFSPDGSLVASAPQAGNPTESSTVLRVWDARTGELRWERSYGTLLGTVDFNADGSLLAAPLFATSATTGAVELIATATGQVIDTLPVPSWASSLAFAPDGSLVVSRWDGIVEVHEPATGPGRELLSVGVPIGSVAVNPTGSLLAIGTERTSIWDMRTGRQVVELPDHIAGRMSFSSDGTRLVTGSQDFVARLWVPTTAGPGEVLSLEPAAVAKGVALDQAGSLLAVLARDDPVGPGPAQIWSWADQALQCTIPGSHGYGLALSPDAATVAVFSTDRLSLWDTSTCAVRVDLDRSDELIGVEGGGYVAYSPDGRLVAATGTTGLAGLWDAASGHLVGDVWQAAAPGAQANGVTFTPDGTRLLTGDNDGLLRLWTVGTGGLAAELDHGSLVNDVLVGPDGSWAIAMGVDNASMWDLATSKLIRPIEGIWSAGALSPDGSLLAGGAGPAVSIRDVATGRELQLLRGHGAAVTAIRIHPDGRHVVSASDDGTVRVWTLDIDELLDIAGVRVTRSMTDEECVQYLHADSCPGDAHT